MGHEEQGQFSGDGEVERGDFSYMDYVPSEPPLLENARPSASRPGLRHPSTLLSQPRMPAYQPDGPVPATRERLRPLAFWLGGAASIVLLGLLARMVLFAPTPRTSNQATAAVNVALETQVAGLAAAGWVVSGPAHAQAIAFAPSSPGMAYACAPKDPGAGTSPIDVGVSTDNGHTWKLLPTLAHGTGCDLTIDPDDASDIVVVANVCRGCQTPHPLSLFRTIDGGATWRPWELPLTGSGGMLSFESYQWTWSGSTLYLAPWSTSDVSLTRIAVSVDQGPFYWADEVSLFVGSSGGTTIGGLLGSGDAVYALMEAPHGCTQSCSRVMRSADFGASWTPLAPSNAGLPVRLLQSQASPHGSTLFGQVDPSAATSAYLYVQSTDGGASWQPLPAFPGAQTAGRIVQTPDGTLYAALTHQPGGSAASAATTGIYRLRPDDATWALAAQLPPEPADPGEPAWTWCVAWDTHGVPLALWGELIVGVGVAGNDGAKSRLEYHTP